MDGEGCFYFYIGKQTNTTIQLQASLEIAQNTHDILVLEKIKEFLGCGRLKPKLSSPIDLESVKNIPTISRLIISNPTDIKTKIIPLFDNYPLRTTKLLDYEDWKKLIRHPLRGWFWGLRPRNHIVYGFGPRWKHKNIIYQRKG